MAPLHFALGANPLGQTFVTGFGAKPVQHVSHIFLRSIGRSFPGLAVGGPNEREQSNIAPRNRGLLSYADDDRSYATNEYAIDYDSALIALLVAHPEHVNNFNYFIGRELPKYGYPVMMLNTYGDEQTYDEFLAPIAAAIRAGAGGGSSTRAAASVSLLGRQAIVSDQALASGLGGSGANRTLVLFDGRRVPPTSPLGEVNADFVPSLPVRPESASAYEAHVISTICVEIVQPLAGMAARMRATSLSPT